MFTGPSAKSSPSPTTTEPAASPSPRPPSRPGSVVNLEPPIPAGSGDDGLECFGGNGRPPSLQQPPNKHSSSKLEAQLLPPARSRPPFSLDLAGGAEILLAQML